ncbi:hypothetical protein [Halioxenophilus sp. WMMB6]|uniref:hypothetical protein n=1 Tax=Halioxenophilus sp. WMMB6 TaxID=3073815 RepID=UPI00295F379B|nr:hypothetical protein [Halioxenophilus sp. WMMB6]
MKKRQRNTRFSMPVMLVLCASGNVMAGGLFAPEFFPGDFSTPLTINNQYWPLPVNTAYVYFSETADGCEWDEVDVTNQIRFIDGINTRIVLDRVWLDESENCADQLNVYPSGFPYGNLAEITQDYHAQDDSGNIWYLGEHTLDMTIAPAECETYVYGTDAIFPALNVCLDGSFIAGENDALAGIVMMASPSKGDFYQQEFDQENAEDWGKVLNFVTVEDSAGGQYANCLETKEWSPLEHGAIEHKYYCPEADGGRGALLQVKEASGGPTVWTNLIDVHAFAP